MWFFKTKIILSLISSAHIHVLPYQKTKNGVCLLIIYQQLTDFTVPKWLRLIIFNYIQKQTTGTCTIQTVWLDQIFKAISQDKYMYYLFEKENCTLNFIFYAKNSITYVTLIIKSLHKWMSFFFFPSQYCTINTDLMSLPWSGTRHPPYSIVYHRLKSYQFLPLHRHCVWLLSLVWNTAKKIAFV